LKGRRGKGGGVTRGPGQTPKGKVTHYATVVRCAAPEPLWTQLAGPRVNPFHSHCASQAIIVGRSFWLATARSACKSRQTHRGPHRPPPLQAAEEQSYPLEADPCVCKNRPQAGQRFSGRSLAPILSCRFGPDAAIRVTHHPSGNKANHYNLYLGCRGPHGIPDWQISYQSYKAKVGWFCLGVWWVVLPVWSGARNGRFPP
jgi:hypothetical protein